MELAIQKVWFEHDMIFALMNNEQTASMPLKWFPRLKAATAAQLEKYELWNGGQWLHWEELDEDLSAEGFLTYKKAPR